MKINRSKFIAAFFFVVVFVVWIWTFWFSEVFSTHASNERHRAAVLGIYDSVSLGASYNDVLSAYWRYRTDSLRLSAEGPDKWLITMPRELGARDWQLWVEFSAHKVVALRVRMAEGPPPKDGPEDKGKGYDAKLKKRL